MGNISQSSKRSALKGFDVYFQHEQKMSVKRNDMKDNKQFGKWFWLRYSNLFGHQTHKILNDLLVPDKWAFLWGVYLEFFDSVGIYIDMNWSQFMNKPLQFSSFVNHNLVGYYLTRQEAQEAAIDKAFEILEKK